MNSELAKLPPCKTEQDLLERYGGIALEKQYKLAEVIGDNNWNADTEKGEISFGEKLVFPMQVLGTFSHSSNTWLWAWGNTQSDLPQSITNQALLLKEYGEKDGIDLLTVGHFEANNNDLHLIGSIASGMFDSSAYYIADYGEGAVVVTIKSDIIDNVARDMPHYISTTFSQLIMQQEVNHRNSLKCYLLAKEYKVSDNEKLMCATKGENVISAEFDDSGRLVKLNA